MSYTKKKISYTVEVLIVRKNRVLIRMHDKYKVWLGAGGHIETDEDPNEAAYREVIEETGLTVRLISPRPIRTDYTEAFKRDLVPPWFINRHRVDEERDRVAFVYFAAADTDIIEPQSEGDRSDQYMWASLEELDTLGLKEDILHYAKTALEVLRKEQ